MISDDPLPAMLDADGIVDFSAPAASVEMAGAGRPGAHRPCHRHHRPDAKPTSPRSPPRRCHAPIVRSGNMSLGVNLLARLVARSGARARRRLRHRDRRDASPDEGRRAFGHGADARRGGGQGPRASISRAIPSAAATGSPARASRARSASPRCAAARWSATTASSSPATASAIVLSHHAEDRSLFARGALKAALWAHGRKPGLYSMADVLGFS